MTNIDDPSNYLALCAPFANADEANAALTAFYEDVRAARNKHRIADVLVVTSTNVNYKDAPGFGVAICFSHNGDSMKAEGMAAYAYGQSQAEHREAMNLLLAGKKGARK